jgi:hypothetical protein
MRRCATSPTAACPPEGIPDRITVIESEGRRRREANAAHHRS